MRKSPLHRAALSCGDRMQTAALADCERLRTNRRHTTTEKTTATDLLQLIFCYSNMSLNVPRPFPKMGTLLDLQNGYIHLKDPKRVHCCSSGKQAENGYITRLLGKKCEQCYFLMDGGLR